MQKKLESSLRRAEKALVTRSHLQRPPPFLRDGKGVARAVTPSKAEPQSLPRKILDRRGGKAKSIPKEKTGIPFYTFNYNSVQVLNETYLVLLYTYQLCQSVWSIHDYRIAKQYQCQVNRFLLRWRKVYKHSRIVKRYWKCICVTLRLAKGSAKQRDRHFVANAATLSLRASASIPRDED